MMFEEVMIQIGVQSNLCKQSNKLRRSDDSNREGLEMLRMREAKAKNQ